MALFQRERTGRGTRVEVSMLEALSEWMTQPRLFAEGTGKPPRRTAASHPSIAPYGPLRAGDGREVLFGIQNEREWSRFCAEVLDDSAAATDPRFATNPDRVANRTALSHARSNPHSRHTPRRRSSRASRAPESPTAASTTSGTSATTSNSPPATVGALWTRPAAAIHTLLPPINLDGVDASNGKRSGRRCRYTDAVLRELGFTPERIAELRDAGAI